VKSNAKIVDLFKRQSKRAISGLSAQYDNTRLCQSFYNAIDSNYEDNIQFSDTRGRKRRAMVRFQKIGQSIDSVVGFMAQNRRQAKFAARVTSSEQQAKYSRNMNELYDYHRENMNADQVESKQDLDLVVNGYGATETDLSYIVGKATTLPGGEIIKVRVDPLMVYWDSQAKGGNLQDARYCGYYSVHTLQDALELFESSKEDDFEKVGTDEDKSGYSYYAEGGLYDRIRSAGGVDWDSEEDETVKVYNHQWFEYETFYRATNPIYQMTDMMQVMHAKMRLDIIKSELKTYAPAGINAGDLFDFDPLAEELVFDEATKAKLVKEFGDWVKPVGFKRKCFYTAVVSGDHVFSAFKNVCQQGFSIKFKTGNYNERGKFFVGMVNAMIEPQKYYNKALTELMFTIASNSKGGVMVEEGSVADIAKFEAQYAKTNAVIQVAAGALSGGKIQPKAQASLPTGLENIITLSDSAISANGVDPAFLGDAGAQETGILYKRRIRQIISKLWWVADAITLYQKEDARLCADLIRVWVENNQGQLFSLTGEDGKEVAVLLANDMMAAEYDVTIQEGAQTPEDKVETASFIGSMGDKYLSIGNMGVAGALFAESLQMMPLDGDVRGRLAEVLNPNGQSVPMAQYQQLQQQLQQLQSQLAMAQAENIQSMTQLNLAKVNESAASAAQKQADAMAKTEEAAQKNIETQVIRRLGNQATVTI